ncbi:hypothetical protein W02_07490 [Nitrospira sp. KM1]|uniref:carbon-nitrogen hydrolase family protein n=1 Tax=Nitrospira sp. KM1 TaxID=1936990 RepID=UPI0013A7B3CC|nr:carbon-nitrogen hydrolase family protein [Nitrospira sp. KM1]BCA53609.1 hypothetical protein W02_07490 [Nitrospira sp. KM1]
MTASTLRIAFLHLAPVPGDLAGNRRTIETALHRAASHGAAWILTPELPVTGYTFAGTLGTAWIEPQPDAWLTHLYGLARTLDVTLFLSHPDRDRKTGFLYNSLFVITPNQLIAGSHRKINALRTGSESWSQRGESAIPINVPPVGLVGLLICADAYSATIATSLKTQGARLLVSSAAWAPGYHGPDGEWERCTTETELPLLVCNRTGRDLTLDFTQAQSIVAGEGRRMLSMESEEEAIFLIEWDLATNTLASRQADKINIS